MTPANINLRNTAPRVLCVQTIDTPLGGFMLVADETGVLRAAEFADCMPRLRAALDHRFGAVGYHLAAAPVHSALTAAMAAYFAGNLTAITTMPLDTGGTAFQQTLWQALRATTPAACMSYAAMAAQLGRPKAARAVGAANGANPVCIVVPCHRLIGANGALTGYSGGLARKRWLIDHERRHATPRTSR